MAKEIRSLKTYHRSTMIKLFDLISSGENTAIVGVGSLGKSNFLRAVKDPEVIQSYLRSWDKYLFVYVDAHLLLHESANQKHTDSYAGYELFMSKLRATLVRLHGDKSWRYPTQEDEREYLLERVEEQYRNVRQAKDGRFMALRYFEILCDLLLYRHPDLHLIFLIDEIERFFHYLPVHFFEQLRGVRDDYKRQIMFVTTSRYTMNDLRNTFDSHEDREIVEGFTELFKTSELALPRMSLKDALEVIGVYKERYKKPYVNDDIAKLLYLASMGHAGLIRHGFIAASEYELTSQPIEYQQNDFNKFLIEHPTNGTVDECISIFESLNENEQEELLQVAIHDRPQKIAPDVLANLVKKQIVYVDESKPQSVPVVLPVLLRFLQMGHNAVGNRAKDE